MKERPLTNRQKAIRRHNVATLVALLTFLAFVLKHSAFGPGSQTFITSALFVLWCSSIVIMFRTRNADEYVAAIWRNSTSAAFMITAASIVIVPFLEGLYEGFIGLENTGGSNFSENFVAVVLLSFFATNAWARVRGT